MSTTLFSEVIVKFFLNRWTEVADVYVSVTISIQRSLTVVLTFVYYMMTGAWNEALIYTSFRSMQLCIACMHMTLAALTCWPTYIMLNMFIIHMVYPRNYYSHNNRTVTYTGLSPQVGARKKHRLIEHKHTNKNNLLNSLLLNYVLNCKFIRQTNRFS